MTPDSISIDECILVSATFVGAGSATDPLDYHGEAKTASGLSNRLAEPNHVCAQAADL